MTASVHPHGSFATDWLQLREPVDHGARASSLTDEAARWLGGRTRLRILDLGSGSGSNLRYLAPRLPGPQSWLLLDHDPALLEEVRTRALACTDAAGQRLELATRLGDLADLEDAFGRQRFDLVTASALLDLVSAPWLEEFAARSAAQQALVLITLSYNGEVTLRPGLAADQRVLDRVNAHQRADKGLGRALGPDAGAALAVALERRGYRVRRRPSPWHLGTEQDALQIQLLEGWARAAAEQDPTAREAIQSWLGQRCSLVQQGRSRIRVGHGDLLAVPG